MTQIETLTLSLAYVVPLALLGLLVSSARPPSRRLLILVLALLPPFYVGHYFLLQAIQGWPVDGAPPDEFRLLAFDIREPNPGTGDGEIRIWIHGTEQPSPRVHRLPYTRELHRALDAAGARIAQGTPQTGRRRVAVRNADPVGDTARSGTFSFHDEQPRPLPRKDRDRP